MSANPPGLVATAGVQTSLVDTNALVIQDSRQAPTCVVALVSNELKGFKLELQGLQAFGSAIDTSCVR